MVYCIWQEGNENREEKKDNMMNGEKGDITMYQYVTMQWILFFYIYCFIGWVWESCYETVRYHKWVNRGFMHGPFLPIYGFGAISMLLVSIPVRENLILVFLFGMIAATVLEYFTGTVMERLFHVRYWDYSKEFLNLNGHICLKCSIAWGFFSILLVRIIHLRVEKLVFLIPEQMEHIVTVVLTLIIVSDFTVSFYEAMDLRRLLDSLLAGNEELLKLHEQLEGIAALMNEDKELIKAAFDDRLDHLNKRTYKLVESILKRNPGAASRRHKQTLQQIREQIKERL